MECSECGVVSCGMFWLIATRLISLSHEPLCRFISVENSFPLFHAHDLVVAEVHICHAELQLHYSCDRKLNLARLLQAHRSFISAFRGHFYQHIVQWKNAENVNVNRFLRVHESNCSFSSVNDHKNQMKRLISHSLIKEKTFLIHSLLSWK